MMVKSNRKSRYLKPFIIAVSVIAGLWIIMAGVEMWLAHKIEHALGPYTLNIDKVNVNLINRSVKLRNIRFASNTPEQGAQDTLAPIVTIAVNQIMATGIRVSNKNGIKDLSLKSLNISSPKINIGRNIYPQPIDSLAKKEINPLNKRLMGVFQSISAQSITIENCKATYNTWNNSQEEAYSVNGLNFEAVNLRIDSTLYSGLLYWDKIRLEASSFNYLFHNEATLLRIDSIMLDTETRELMIGSVELLPQKWGKYEFAKHAKGNADWTQVVSGPIKCKNINYAEFLKDSVLRVGSLTIDGVDIDSYKNRQIPQTPKIKALSYVSLQEMPLKVDILQTNINNITLTYEELSEFGTSPGRIFCDNMRGKFTRITNVAVAEYKYITFDLFGHLEKMVAFNAICLLPTQPSIDPLLVNGTMGAMDLKVLNQITNPLAHAEITSGTLDHLVFEIIAGQTKSEVNMTFLYHDLSVALYKMKDGQLKERTFVSNIVNNRIRKSNPARNGVVRHGNGTFTRDPYRSQFNYIYKSILSGVQNTVIAL